MTITSHNYSVYCSSDATTQCAMESMFSAWKFCHQPDAIHLYTGLESYEKFVFVRQTLGPAHDELICFHGLRPTLSVKGYIYVEYI